MLDNYKALDVKNVKNETFASSSINNDIVRDDNTQTSLIAIDDDDISIASNDLARSMILLDMRVFDLVNSFFTHKCRMQLKSVYLSIWNKNDLHAIVSNAIYDSRDRRDHINRRIFKKIYNEVVIIEKHYDTRKIACSHENIIYMIKYVDMIKKQMNTIIMSLLRAQIEKETND